MEIRSSPEEIELLATEFRTAADKSKEAHTTAIRLVESLQHVWPSGLPRGVSEIVEEYRRGQASVNSLYELAEVLRQISSELNDLDDAIARSFGDGV